MNEIIRRQRSYFLANQTKPVEFRIQQLKTLKQLLLENEAKLNDAVYQDFRKSPFDTYSTELALLYMEIDAAIRNIKKWSTPKRVKTNILNFPGKSYILPEPLGVCLIIGAWNYPYQLSFGPVISALAAGNTVVLKPSELPSNTSHLMAELVKRYFDPACFTVVEGGITETQTLLEQRFDKLFFTGSVTVGRIVYQAAAKHLTPVTLELGGKSPAFVLDDASLNLYARRLVWAKFLNAGQTCIAPDYVLVSEHLKDKLLETLAAEIQRQSFSLENNNYVQIINEKNLDRLSYLLEGCHIYCGGGLNRESRTMEPTLLDGIGFNAPVMQEEIFGPILPVIAFKSLEDAISEVKNREKPLSCYIYTKNTNLKEKILQEVSFGGGAVNDSIMHIANTQLPFGGVGQSGIGSYHGIHGFQTFSHFKSILEKGTWFEPSIKYHPHTGLQLTLMRWLSKLG
jgi:aldehyde dehydrogenase (NAD+)